MFRIISFGARVQAPKFLLLYRMSKNGDQVYYAVGRGREIGIYSTWGECKAQVDGIQNAKYRKFFSLPEAEEFVKFWKNYSSPSKESQVVNSVSNFKKNGANYRRGSDDGVMKPKTLVGLGVGDNNLQNGGPVSLQPYVSPIPTPLRSQFYDRVRNEDNFQISPKPKERTCNGERYNALSQTHSVETNSLEFVAPKNSSFTCTPVKSSSVEVPQKDYTNDSQSANLLSVNVKKETVREEEEVSEVCRKLPQCLTILETALRSISSGSSAESDKIRNILKVFLEKMPQTNNNVNPQMETGENVKNAEGSNVEERMEVTPSQQQTGFSSPGDSQPKTSTQVSFDQKNPDILALNLRLDSFEKRFDACLKEVGAIGSEISHIKSEIREMKESLNQSGSSRSPKKAKDGMLQTTLRFGSPNKNESSRMDYSSSRSYTTDQGGSSKEGESGEYKTNRRKRRRLSRSDSTGSDKNVAEEKYEDILSRIKTEEVEYTSFCLDENDFVEVYTDGACHYNGERDAKAGIGIWFGDSHPLNVSEPVMGMATNNVAEIQAARIAIELAVKAGVKKLKILTDSEFLINCVTKWMHRWKRNGWTLVKGGTVKNRKELEKLDKAASKISVRWEKVLAHSGIKGNEMADRLANQGAEKYKR